MASSSGRQPNFTALNRGRHLCLAGRPSRWALAHILVFDVSSLWDLLLDYSALCILVLDLDKDLNWHSAAMKTKRVPYSIDV